MTTILLIEDDPALGETLRTRLSRKFAVQWTSTCAGARATQLAKIDLAIIDLALPDGDGFSIASELKTRFQEMRVIFLTAHSTAEHRLKGFEVGADDFIPKPFHLKELLLRMDRLLHPSSSSVVHSSGITLNPAAHSVTLPDGEVVYPSARDFTLLRHLIASAPRVVSREELLETIFPRSDSEEGLPTTRTIDNSIVRLRQHLRSSERELIRSVRGQGYQWIGE